MHTITNWLLVMGDYTDYDWSYSLKQKSELGGVMMSLLKGLKAIYGIDVRCIQCDNVSENKAVQTGVDHHNKMGE